MVRDSIEHKLIAVVPREGLEAAAVAAVAEERKRIVGLIDYHIGHLVASKGRGWLSELEQLKNSVEFGQQQISGTF